MYLDGTFLQTDEKLRKVRGGGTCKSYSQKQASLVVRVKAVAALVLSSVATRF